MESQTKRFVLADLMTIIQKKIEETVPAAWTTFATDVIELYNIRENFVEGTHEAH